MTLDELRLQYREQILGIAKKYHAENVRIFGSFARGKATAQSDIDILVHFKQSASLLDEAGLDSELSQLLGRAVDLVGDDVIRDEFRPFIMQDAVVL